MSTPTPLPQWAHEEIKAPGGKIVCFQVEPSPCCDFDTCAFRTLAQAIDALVDHVDELDPASPTHQPWAVTPVTMSEAEWDELPKAGRV